MAELTTATVTSRIAGEIEIEGKTYQVRKLDGYGWEQLRAARGRVLEGGDSAVTDSYQIASRLIVGLTPLQVIGTTEEPGLLDKETALRVIEIAGQSIQAAEAALGKGAAAPATP